MSLLITNPFETWVDGMKSLCLVAHDVRGLTLVAGLSASDPHVDFSIS